MGSNVLTAALRNVFKHNDFKSKLQKEAIECIYDGKATVLHGPCKHVASRIGDI